MKKLLIAMLIGAAVAYLLDPDNGVRRRDELRRKLESYRKSATDAASSGTASDAASVPNPPVA